MPKGAIHLKSMTIPNQGYSHTGKFDADTGGRAGRHANMGRKKVERAIRKAQRRAWNKEATND